MSDNILAAVEVKIKSMNRPQKADALARVTGLEKNEIQAMLEEYVKEGKLAHYELKMLKNQLTMVIPNSKKQDEKVVVRDTGSSPFKDLYYGLPGVIYKGGFVEKEKI